MTALDDYRAEVARTERDMQRTLQTMGAGERRDWQAYREAHEYFDGETEIEYGALLRWLSNRRGGRR